MDPLLFHRLPAPALLVPPDRRGLVETCRRELVWARDDWLRLATLFGLDTEQCEGDGTPAWQAACLPHERAAAHLLNVWGHLHPQEHRLREAIVRLRKQRAAGWDSTGTLEDIAWYRHERRALWHAFLDSAAHYRRQRQRLASAPASARRAGLDL